MDEKLKNMIEQDMKLLSFVQWDRFVENYPETKAYGWIAREDQYKDFVMFVYSHNVKDNNYSMSWTTSSDKYSKEIQRLFAELDGVEPGEHHDCQRVEHFFNIPNMIKK